MRNLDDLTLAVVKYYDGTKALVADKEWIKQLKQLLLSAKQPKQFPLCLCINYPQIELITGDHLAHCLIRNLTNDGRCLTKDLTDAPTCLGRFLR